DITGRVLESLAWHGYRISSGHTTAEFDGYEESGGLEARSGNREHEIAPGLFGLPENAEVQPQLKRAVDFIRARQDTESGAWFGRWGVNYIYGTWQAVGGLRRLGVNMHQPWIQKAGHWLKSVQQDDGSFGETALSYENPALKGTGPSTASQTAWAAMTLLSIYGPSDPDVARAIRWLMQTQLRSPQPASGDPADTEGPVDPAGSWSETEFTGTGFPRVFYLRYHMYRLYFPLMALARYRRARQSSSPGT
ncbi:MAG: hypothetical protein ACOC0P_00630, partial [Planctomycetota bacterium]